MNNLNKTYPTVAIVGKPNVGKSSLFNALLNRKKSLVAKEAGVTRDPVEAEYKDTIRDLFFYLVDTGGISYTLKHDFIEDTIEFAREAIHKSDLILFVIDGTMPITQDDQVLIDLIRKFKMDRTILLVNKMDHLKREFDAYEFYKLGFEHTVFVSAAHKIGMDDIKDTIFQRFTELDIMAQNEFSNDNDDNYIKCVLLGKPNVGKSSFFNNVIKEEKAMVSEIAGTTRDVLQGEFSFKNKQFSILDIAGFRRKNKIAVSLEKDTVKKGLWAIRKQDVILILIDASDKVSEQDKKLVELAMKEQKAMVIGLNKWDLLPNNPDLHKVTLEDFAFDLKLASFVPIIPLSTKTGQGISQLLSKMIKVRENYTTRIKPRELIEFLKSCIKEKPPFSKLGELKIYYVVQVSDKPPHFQLFVNNHLIITPSYEKFLRKALYQKYSLEGVPLKLTVKNRH